MKNEYYEVVIEFSNSEMKDLVEQEIKSTKDPRIITDEDIENQYAEDSLLLALIISFVMEVGKNVNKETVQWFFEYLKSIFKKKKD